MSSSTSSSSSSSPSQPQTDQHLLTGPLPRDKSRTIYLQITHYVFCFSTYRSKLCSIFLNNLYIHVLHITWTFCVCDRFCFFIKNPTRGSHTPSSWMVHVGCVLLPAFTRLGHECQDLLRPCDGMHECTERPQFILSSKRVVGEWSENPC